MKIALQSNPARRRQDGIAVIVMLVLIAMVVTFICANSQTLAGLRADVNLIEQQQLRRLNSFSTNAVNATSANVPTSTASNGRTAGHD
jgi:hypothetical protein